MDISAENAIKREIILEWREMLLSGNHVWDRTAEFLSVTSHLLDDCHYTDGDILIVYDEYDFGDLIDEFRCSGHEAHDLPCPDSNHYEIYMKGRQLSNGKWVSWPFYYGGGKWGDPESIDWMGQAVYVSCVEEERIVIHRTFSKLEKSDD